MLRHPLPHHIVKPNPNLRKDLLIMFMYTRYNEAIAMRTDNDMVVAAMRAENAHLRAEVARLLACNGALTDELRAMDAEVLNEFLDSPPLDETTPVYGSKGKSSQCCIIL
jgi:hypothetical protein